MKTIWFRSKLYGWGWYPSTWQGWLVLFVYIAMVFKAFRYVDLNSHSVSDTLYGFIVQLFFITLALSITCYLTGEKPYWRWGK